MKRSVFSLLGLIFLASSTLEANTFKCKYSQDCYLCEYGGKMDECHITCNVCWGNFCPGQGEAVLGEEGVPASELADGKPSDPLQPLYRFPAEPIAEAIDPHVASALAWFWKVYDQPLTKRRPSIDMIGGVAIDGEGHEAMLRVRQLGETQRYFLTIDGYVDLVLTVNAPAEGKVELEWEIRRAGATPLQVGRMMLPAS